MESRPGVSPLQTEPLEWMRENLLLVSNIVRIEGDSVAFASQFRSNSAGRVVIDDRENAVPIESIDGWQCNSASGLLACCYLEALGKIATDARGNKERFLGSISTLLADELTSDDATLLWKSYRNAWAHSFIVWNVGFSRSTDRDLWLPNVNEKANLNISWLVELTLSAIDRLDAKLVDKIPVQPIRVLHVLKALSSK